MDILVTLRDKIEALEDGEHITGLRSVLLHIETAFRHLQRGKDTYDETAFTDAIYRSNQAFEGSIKEGFRVLAGKPPEHMRPFDIEVFLEKKEVFRPRVLSQFTNYRTEWRNPSAHDYKLDFDESEAFIAIISVTAFACLLSDQIAEHLAFIASKEESEKNKKKLQLDLRKTTDPIPFIDNVADALLLFSKQQPSQTVRTESQLVGSLSGFLSAIAPEYRVSVEEKLAEGRFERADLAVRHEQDLVVVELKRARWSKSIQRNAIGQLEHYLQLSNTKSGILYFASDVKTEFEVVSHEVPHSRGRILIIRPKDLG